MSPDLRSAGHHSCIKGVSKCGRWIYSWEESMGVCFWVPVPFFLLFLWLEGFHGMEVESRIIYSSNLGFCCRVEVIHSSRRQAWDADWVLHVLAKGRLPGRPRCASADSRLHFPGPGFRKAAWGFPERGVQSHAGFNYQAYGMPSPFAYSSLTRCIDQCV